MPSVSFRVKPQIEIDEAWEELAQSGCEPLYSSEDEKGAKEIVANIPEDFSISSLELVEDYVPVDLSQIDWEGQWALHGSDYHDGFVHLHPEGVSEPLRLEPGPGFGDMSHPTTRLMVKMMAPFVKGRDVVDIGCGSGVLALTAVALGARVVYGIDIDLDAIRHSRQNALLNGMETRIHFGFAEELELEGVRDLVVLMNMIQSEQIQAWASVKPIHGIAGDCIVSGILKEGRDEYLELAKRWGWIYVSELEEDGWLCFHFRR